MLKLLIKKQFFELFSFLFMDKKKGTRRSGAGTVGFLALVVVALGFLMLLFLGIADSLASVLLNPGFMAGNNNDWMYFALLGSMAIFMGVFGSVFNTYASLYQAKDNEFLLSMPIKPSVILLSRMLGVYIMSLIYSGIIWLPTVLTYWMYKLPTVTSILYPLLITFINAALVSVLTCLLGWLVATASAHLRRKNLITIILSILFFAVYYYICFNLSDVITGLVANAEAISTAIKARILPLYLMGLGAAGDSLGFAGYLLFTVVCFTICYVVMSKTFIRLATSNKGAKKIAYTGTKEAASSVNKALFKRELRHFTSNPSYMMNTGLGIAFLPALAVLAAFKLDTLMNYADMLFGDSPEKLQIVGFISSIFIGMLVTTDVISAPSVSLEGKTMWLINSLPVKGSAVLAAKRRFAFVMNAVPAVLASVVFAVLFRPGLLMAVLMVIFSLLFCEFVACFGLTLNLKRPSLNWTSEATPIKQSMPVMVALFGGWIIVIVSGALYLVIGSLSVTTYFMLLNVVYLLVDIGLVKWIETRGARIFEGL